MLKETYRMTGTVKWYNEKKGYGFITSDRTGEDVFLHHTALQPQEEVQVVTGDRITFKIQNQKKGLAALEVKYFSDESEVIQSDQEAGIGKSSSKIDSKINEKIKKETSQLISKIAKKNPKLMKPIINDIIRILNKQELSVKIILIKSLLVISKHSPEIVPIDVIANPSILSLFNFSLKKIKASTVIIMGANKHTKRAGRDGSIMAMAEY